MIRYLIFVATISFFFAGIISKEDNDSKEKNSTQYEQDDFQAYNKDYSHCFRFTWLGPGYDNTSKVNGSCNYLSDKYKLKGTPCKQPLVITDNAEPPNMTDIFLMYPDYVTCRRSKGQVCIKYSYKYNGKYDNITYMCGKVRTEGEGAETQGCFSEYNSGYEKQVCVCTPKTQSDGGMPPCNSANGRKMSGVGLLAGFLLCLIFSAGYRWENLY